jgi:hypothetical protein
MRWKGLKGKAWEAAKAHTRYYEKHCYTCPKTNLIANGYKADTGHYKLVAIVGSNNIWSWDKRFLHLQCSHCNGPGQGTAHEFAAHLVKGYGAAGVADFEANYRKVSPVKNWQAVIVSFQF